MQSRNIPDFTIVSVDPAISVEDGKIDLVESSLSIPQAEKVVRTYVAGESISALKCVAISGGQARLGSNSSLSLASVIGVALNAAAPGQMVSVLQYGVIEDSFLNLAQNSLLFVGANGEITEAAPSSGHLTRIGRAIDQTSALILIENPITL